MKTIQDKIWILLNKQPPRPYESYIQVVGFWFVLGIVFSTALWLSIDQEVEYWYIHAPALTLLASLMGYALVTKDKQGRVYDAIAQHSLQTWHNVKKRIEHGHNNRHGR